MNFLYKGSKYKNVSFFRGWGEGELEKVLFFYKESKCKIKEFFFGEGGGMGGGGARVSEFILLKIQI